MGRAVEIIYCQSVVPHSARVTNTYREGRGRGRKSAVAASASCSTPMSNAHTLHTNGAFHGTGGGGGGFPSSRSGRARLWRALLISPGPGSLVGGLPARRSSMARRVGDGPRNVQWREPPGPASRRHAPPAVSAFSRFCCKCALCSTSTPVSTHTPPRRPGPLLSPRASPPPPRAAACSTRTARAARVRISPWRGASHAAHTHDKQIERERARTPCRRRQSPTRKKTREAQTDDPARVREQVRAVHRRRDDRERVRAVPADREHEQRRRQP
jgi:hypothetical protein